MTHLDAGQPPEERPTPGPVPPAEQGPEHGPVPGPAHEPEPPHHRAHHAAAAAAVVLLVLGRRGLGPLPVHFVGKGGTFALLYAFPLLFLAHGTSAVAQVAWVLGWAFSWWGVALYWLAAALYVWQAVGLLRVPRPAEVE